MIEFIPDARRIALRSYSQWSQYLGLVCLFLPEVLLWRWQIDTDPRIWWFSGVGLIIFGMFGRLIVQPPRRSWPRLVVLIAAVALLLGMWARPVLSAPVSQEAFIKVAVPLVSRWEGKENRAYLDTIAVPPVWTVCHGETRGVRPGDYHTDAECAAMLARRLLEFRNGLHRAFTPTTLQHRLTPKRDAAYVSLAYNAGLRAIRASTAVRRLNAGDIVGGCRAIGWWNRSGSRVVRGLVNRRAVDVAYCLEGAI